MNSNDRIIAQTVSDDEKRAMCESLDAPTQEAVGTTPGGLEEDAS